MAVTNLTFDGKSCTRVVVKNLNSGDVLMDTDTLIDYQVTFTTNQNTITMLRYDQDTDNNLLLTKEHRVLSYERAVSITITY